MNGAETDVDCGGATSCMALRGRAQVPGAVGLRLGQCKRSAARSATSPRRWVDAHTNPQALVAADLTPTARSISRR